jgi:hypothetical protein
MELFLSIADLYRQIIFCFCSGGWGDWTPLWMCGPSLKGSTVGNPFYFGSLEFLIIEYNNQTLETKATIIDCFK